ncbi:MAG: GntP family permease [Bacteroidetes bacterium]|nr:GntP family permease [Bacteroidota bacterium]
MNHLFLQEFMALLAGLGVIILLTAKFHLHAFFALLIACFITGLGLQMPLADIINVTKEGFGNILKSLGLIIVLGTCLGILLEQSGSTKAMANYILKKVGKKNASLALSLTGFVVGLPVFCDSGYIVLNGLNKSFSQKSGTSIVVMSVSLATGLYAVHCLVPPHPGAAAAAGTLNVDFGKLILVGSLIAIPSMLVGHLWAVLAGRNTIQRHDDAGIEEEEKVISDEPSALKAFLPIIVPILLISLSSIIKTTALKQAAWKDLLLFLGDPVIALSIGILLALATKKNWGRNQVNFFLKEAAEKAGGILVIIGAGGAFGAILATAKIGNHLNEIFALEHLGLLFPFLVCSLIKTAQGSSTVAIITTAPILFPLLKPLGLDSENGRMLAVLSMGAGSMMVSHANDAYFWVITKFSGLEVKTMLKVYSLATVFMGLTTLLMVYFLSLFLL